MKLGRLSWDTRLKQILDKGKHFQGTCRAFVSRVEKLEDSVVTSKTSLGFKSLGITQVHFANQIFFYESVPRVYQ